jgi:putative nucleotidyltransferase with HDIG domain/PAS domain S-box-containing protein
MATAPFRANRFSARIALIYLGASLVWILFSDWLAALVVPENVRIGITVLQNAKGVIFVTASALLIYGLSRHGTDQLERTLQSLGESERRFRLAMGISREWVWERDLITGTMLCSPGLADLLSYPGAEPATDFEHWLGYVHADDRERVRAAMTDHIQGRRPEYTSIHRLRGKDGSYVWVMSRGRVVKEIGEASRRLVGSDLDITDRKLLEDELGRVNRALTALAAGNRAMVVAASRPGLFFATCRTLVEEAGYPLVWIGHPLEDESASVLAVASHGDRTGYLHNLNLSWNPDLPGGQTTTALAVRTGRSALCQDLVTDPGQEPWRERAQAAGIRSSLALPLIQGGRVVAVLNVCAAEKLAFDARETSILETLALDLGYALSALDRAQLQTTPGPTHPPAIPARPLFAIDGPSEAAPLIALSRLKAVLVSCVAALSQAVEKRDPFTAGHELRVAALAVEIAHRLGLDEDQVEGVRLGALMHDIGKIAVPVELLNRPGRLSAQEYELIRSHPQTGYDIVRGIDFPWPVHRIVLEHHERLDGSGYPRRLSGEQICLEARIVAVADVVEAILSHRPYRPGLGLDCAIDEITRQPGYDPAVVEACIQTLKTPSFAFPDQLDGLGRSAPPAASG